MPNAKNSPKQNIFSILLMGFSFILLACATPDVNQSAAPVANQITAPDASPDRNAFSSEHPYFTGDGRAGMSLGILPPESQGLGEDRSYLPTLIQGILVANISRHSAISVLDRLSLDRVIMETLDPAFEDNLDIVRLGHVAHVDYWLTGRLIPTSAGYTLQLNVTDTTPTARTLAAHSGNWTAAQINDQSAIQQASLDLLRQMGVQLTDRSINNLNTTNAAQIINAQTALTHGIIAQRQGTEVAALSYFFQAAALDPTLLEAADRSSQLSASISSGNIGEAVRNDIQWRREWAARLAEAEDFFSSHLPFEIVYNPNLTQGRIDFQRETVDLSTTVQIRPTDGFKVLETLRSGLVQTGRMGDWGFAAWPIRAWGENSVGARQGNPGIFLWEPSPVLFNGSQTISIIMGLYNEHGEQLSTASLNLKAYVRFAHVGSQHDLRNNESWRIPSNILVQTGRGGQVFDMTRFVIRRRMQERDFFASSHEFPAASTIFRNVNANDITGNLAVRIISVNGIDAETAARTGFIRISAGVL